MNSYVALLRGVNVGGNNKLHMKELASLCESLGCSSVQTYIQSGNVVFHASKKTVSGFAPSLKKKIKEEFGFDTTAVLRDAAELKAVAGNNPFLKPGVDPKTLHVTFLASKPSLVDVVKLNPVCEGEEAFALRGLEIFLYLPNGLGRSKMGSYAFDKVLKTVGTTRNWRTVLTLLELTEKARPSQ